MVGGGEKEGEEEDWGLDGVSVSKELGGCGVGCA